MKQISIKTVCLLSSVVLAGFVGCDKLPDEPLTHKSNPDYPAGSAYTLEFINDVDGKWGKVRAYKDITFDNIFTRDMGWNGGDGVYSTLLPDGSTFWSFGDSFFGKLLDAKQRIRGGDESNFPRNGAAIQTGMEYGDIRFLNELVQTTDPTLHTYYKGKTFLRHPDAVLTDAEVNEGKVDADKFYWSGDATVCTTGPHAPILQVIWGAMKPIEGTDTGTERFETAYSSYSLKGGPSDPDYMKQVEYEQHFRPYTTTYGSTMWEDVDGHLYLYGGVDQSVVVARAATLDLRSEWEYYIKTESGNFEWQATAPTQAEMKRSIIVDGGQWASQPTILKIDNVYYMIAQEGGFGKDVFVWKSDKPYGPFSDRKTIFSIPTRVNKLGETKYGNAYNVFIHPQFSRQGELVLSANMDAPSFWDNFGKVGSADFYRPYFFRLFNWLSVYDQKK